MKIRKKASLLFVSLFVTAFLIVGVIILMFGKDNLTRIISNNLKSISSIQLNRIESIDSQNLERLNLISSRTQLRISLNDYNENPQEMLQQKMNAILDDAKLSVSDFDQISIINLNGKIVASTDKTIIGENADINDSVFILSQKQNITNIYKLDETGDLKIYMYGPLVYNDKTLGVVTVIASSVKIQNFLSDYSGLGKSGYTSVVFIDNYSDKNPIISPERFDSVFRYKQVNYSELSQISKRILDKKTGVFQNILDEKKELVFASIEYSENLNLGLSVRISKAEVLTPLRRLLLLLTIVMMGMIIILVFAINYSTKLISKPIESLTERTSRISKGNFDEKIEIESKDEIGLLAKSFNIMLANLRQSESRWQFALESSGDGVWDWNAQSNEVFFSKRWKEMLGYKEDEIANNFEEWDMLLHPDDKERSYLELNKHFEGKTEIFQLESRLKCKDGTYKWILLRGKIIERTEDNKPLRIIGTHIDLTERKKAEKLLHEREAYSKALFEYAAVPIWVEDFSEVKKYFNKLKEKGVNDFSIYFHENLEEVKHIASLVEVTEINQKNLELYGVTSKEELLS
ncbi:MAG: PAS domain-containing protein, partial [Bacteroidales bacterium]|nr:PAS domain-containing protein [Bacteroidales bacterium]